MLFIVYKLHSNTEHNIVIKFKSLRLGVLKQSFLFQIEIIPFHFCRCEIDKIRCFLSFIKRNSVQAGSTTILISRPLRKEGHIRYANDWLPNPVLYTVGLYSPSSYYTQNMNLSE